MVAFMPADWGFDEVPTEWIYKAYSNFINFHLIFFGFHQVFEEISLLYFLLRHDLGIELINVQFLDQVYA